MDADAAKADPGEDAFRLCEAEWMRRRIVDRLSCDCVARFVEALRSGEGMADSQMMAQVREAIAFLDDAVGAAVASSTLPHGPVEAARADVECAAADALSGGIAEMERALHAASWLPAGLGMRALASSLRESDAARFWTCPVIVFVDTFSGIGEDVAWQVCRAAGVGRERFDELDDRRLASLASVLDRFSEM